VGDPLKIISVAALAALAISFAVLTQIVVRPQLQAHLGYDHSQGIDFGIGVRVEIASRIRLP
jgi:hypothetical protein